MAPPGSAPNPRGWDQPFSEARPGRGPPFGHLTPSPRHVQEQPFSGSEGTSPATFLGVPINPYIVLTVQLFRAQLLAARAAGDMSRAETFEAAIRSLLEGEVAPRFVPESAPRPVAVAN